MKKREKERQSEKESERERCMYDVCMKAVQIEYFSFFNVF